MRCRIVVISLLEQLHAPPCHFWLPFSRFLVPGLQVLRVSLGSALLFSSQLLCILQ